MPLVSFIVPVYNVENYLKKCVDSILKQPIYDWEVLLIDDGSTDNSGKICDEYAQKHPEIKVYHKQNGGVGSARNIGLDAATGRYIFFLDADDWLEEDIFRKISQIIQVKNPDMIQFGFCRITEDGKIMSSFYLVSSDIFCNSFEEYEKLNCYHGGICSFLIKREIIENAHIRFIENIKYAEDGEFIFKCTCLAQNFYVCSDIFYYYLMREGSATQNKFTVNNINDHLIVIDNLLAFIEKRPNLNPFFPKELVKQLSHYLVCFSLMKCSQKDFKLITNTYKQFVDRHKKKYPQIVCGRFAFRLAYHFMFLFVFLTRIYVKLRIINDIC